MLRGAARWKPGRATVELPITRIEIEGLLTDPHLVARLEPRVPEGFDDADLAQAALEIADRLVVAEVVALDQHLDPAALDREDAVLDLKSETCPMTFLHTKLALEKIPQGGKLRVLFGNEKSCTEVSTSCTKEGHTVTPAAHEPQTNRWEVIIERR